MPVTVVVGGQYGSEGKGKVSQYFAAIRRADAVVRVGGPNSGHTALGSKDALILRQLPTASLLKGPLCVLPPGSYIRPEVLIHEIKLVGLDSFRLRIDPLANVITGTNERDELAAGLRERIGSTLSGTGSAAWRRLTRDTSVLLARDVAELAEWIEPTGPILRRLLNSGSRIVIEGTQGLGLSVLHSATYPYSTARETSAAGALSEAGLSPVDVDEVILVLRTFPIRVAGHSGPLSSETSWETLRREGGHDHSLVELSSVTKRVRRVGRFSPDVVRQAIAVNRPTSIVLNHVDYLDHDICASGRLSQKANEGVERLEGLIGQRIDWIGLSSASVDSLTNERPIKAIGLTARG